MLQWRAAIFLTPANCAPTTCSSSRRPLQLAPAQNVNVPMPHALPGVGAGIGHQTKTIGATRGAQLRGDLHHARDCGAVGLRDVLEGFARNYQQMNRRLGRLVGERDANFVLVKQRDFDFAARDFSENGVGHD